MQPSVKMNELACLYCKSGLGSFCFCFVLLGFFNLVNKFEFLKSACFVVAGFGLFFFFPPCCLPKVDLYISDT